MDIGFMIIIGLFVIYYFTVLFLEKKMLSDPKDILDKFLSVLLLYAGVSLIYYSLTGSPFLNESVENYNVYIFIIGFIAILWTIPNLLKEFSFFKKFIRKSKRS